MREHGLDNQAEFFVDDLARLADVRDTDPACWVVSAEWVNAGEHPFSRWGLGAWLLWNAGVRDGTVHLDDPAVRSRLHLPSEVPRDELLGEVDALRRARARDSL